MCVRLQAKFWCTTSSAKKVTVGLTAVALTTTTIGRLCYHLAGVTAITIINAIAFKAIPPVAILVINVVVVVQVRRAASNAAANLGVQPHHHHQSTPNNSAVPTVMLVATSIIYVLMFGTFSILRAALLWAGQSLYENHYEMYDVVMKMRTVTNYLVDFVFAYNFYVYLTTGKRFRSELRDLFRRSLQSSSSSAPAAAGIAMIDAGNDV